MSNSSAKARIHVGIDRLKQVNFGDNKLISSSIRELRIDYGPGYRVYFVVRKYSVIVIRCSGIKRTQNADIRKAIRSLVASKNANQKY